jgi:hypothetical protein
VEPHADPASLDRLHDIVEPARVSFWPPAPGWWIVFGILLVVAALVAWKMRRAWVRSAYRREALREVASMGDSRELPALLKRVALAAYPREEVAGLSGERWLAFLNREVPESFEEPAGSALVALAYGDAEADAEPVVNAIRGWIEHHPSPEDRER